MSSLNPNFRGLDNLREKFAAAGSEYVRYDVSSERAETLTTGLFSRFKACVARFFDGDDRARANRATVANLLESIRRQSGAHGRAVLNAIRGRVDREYAGGKHLSGRAAAAIIGTARTAIQNEVKRLNDLRKISSYMTENPTPLVLGKAGDIMERYRPAGSGAVSVSEFCRQVAAEVKKNLDAMADKTRKPASPDELARITREATLTQCLKERLEDAAGQVLGEAARASGVVDVDASAAADRLRATLAGYVHSEFEHARARDLQPDGARALRRAALEACVFAGRAPASSATVSLEAPVGKPDIRERPDLRREGARELTPPPETLTAAARSERLMRIGDGIGNILRYENEARREPHPVGFADRNDERWTTCEQFDKDVTRDGVWVNGDHIRSPEGFMNLFPGDRRAAALLSRVAHQALFALIETSGSEATERFYGETVRVSLPLMSGMQRSKAETGIEPLGGDRYLVTFENRQNAGSFDVPGMPAAGIVASDRNCRMSFVLNVGGDVPRVEDVRMQELIQGVDVGGMGR